MASVHLKIIQPKKIPQFLTQAPIRKADTIIEDIQRMSNVPGPTLKKGAMVADVSNSNIRIALYRPLGRLGQKSEDGEAVKQIGPPNQLQYIASVLISQGYDVRIFDQLADSYNPERPLDYPSTKSDERMAKEIIDWQPHVLMATSFTPQFRRGLKIAGAVKEYLGLPIVWGGYHVTDVGQQYRTAMELEPDNEIGARILKKDLVQVFQRNIIDYACVGEGITAVLEIIEVLKGRKDPNTVDDIAFAQNGGLRITRRRERLSIDSYPLIFWPDDYDPMKYYSQGRDYPVTLLTTSQGCRFHCTFCSVPHTYPEGLMYATPSTVISQLQEMYRKLKSKWPSEKIMVNLTDEDWMARPDRVIEICNAICKAGLNKHFEFNSFGTLIDAARRGNDMLKAMARAGWSYFFFGVESTMDAAAKDWRRPDSKVHNRMIMIQKGINKTAGKGIMPFVDFIGGHPSHTLEQSEEDYRRFLALRNVPYAYLPIIAPMVGTELYWQVLWGMNGMEMLPGTTYDDLDANHQVLQLKHGGDVKTLRTAMVQEFFTRPEYEKDADRMIERHRHTARFFAKAIAKEAIDYPNNERIRKLTEKYQLIYLAVA